MKAWESSYRLTYKGWWHWVNKRSHISSYYTFKEAISNLPTNIAIKVNGL